MKEEPTLYTSPSFPWKYNEGTKCEQLVVEISKEREKSMAITADNEVGLYEIFLRGVFAGVHGEPMSALRIFQRHRLCIQNENA